MICKMRVQLRINTTSDTWKFLSKLLEALAECKLKEFWGITSGMHSKRNTHSLQKIANRGAFAVQIKN